MRTFASNSADLPGKGHAPEKGSWTAEQRAPRNATGGDVDTERETITLLRTATRDCTVW